LVSRHSTGRLAAGGQEDDQGGGAGGGAGAGPVGLAVLLAYRDILRQEKATATVVARHLASEPTNISVFGIVCIGAWVLDPGGL
jgi:hypothetical protein